MDEVDGGLVPILRSLSKPDAIELFALAGRGISSSKDAREELGLSQKVYYSRLRGLIDAGLVEGRNGSYKQTHLGRIVHGRILPILSRAWEASYRAG